MEEDKGHKTRKDRRGQERTGEELTVNGSGLSKQKINIICLSNHMVLQVFTVIKSPKSF